MPARDLTDLEFQLERNREKITDSFALYTHSVQLSFEIRNIEVEKLRTFLYGLSCFNSSCDIEKCGLLYSKKAKLERADSICKIFAILKVECCCNFLNFHIFELLLDAFEIERDQENLKYPEKIKAYIEKHNISEILQLKPILHEISDDTKKCILVLDIAETSKLIRVTDLVKGVANIVGLNPSAILILDIKKKCVMVIVLLPKSVAEFIFIGRDIFSQDQREQFRNNSVQLLECNGYSFDFTSNKPKILLGEYNTY